MNEDYSLPVTCIIYCRTQQNLFPEFDRERPDITAKPVNQKEFAARCKEKLNLPVIEIIHFRYSAAKRSLERYSSQALSIHLAENQIIVLVLRESVLLSRSAITDSERPLGNNYDGVLQHCIQVGSGK